jgi:hypothetical protein
VTGSGSIQFADDSGHEVRASEEGQVSFRPLRRNVPSGSTGSAGITRRPPLGDRAPSSRRTRLLIPERKKVTC